MRHAAPENVTPAGDAAMSGTVNSVGFSLSQIGLETARQFGEIVGALGLEPRHFAVLHAVQRAEGQAQQAIADRLAIPASTMVAIVDHLEGEGLLERRPHPTDRRTRVLLLTARGELLLTRALSAAQVQEARICTGLGPRERDQLLALLGRISQNLEIPSSALPDRGSGHRPQGL